MVITIVGGGIIGLCSAYYLVKEGFKVQVIDKGDFSNNCSSGNAGLIVPSHIIPLATRGIIKQGLKWMFKKSSPFYFKPRLDYDLAAWSWRFFRASHPGTVQKAIPILRDFSELSRSLYHNMIAEEGFSVSHEKRGLLMLYQTIAAETEEIEAAEKAHTAGLDARILDPGQLQQIDPYTKYNVRGAVYYPNDEHLNPAQLLAELRSYLFKKGVRFISHFEIKDFVLENGHIKVLKGVDKTIPVEHLITSAGVHTARLLRKAGVRLLLQDGKGYSFTVEKPEKSPSIPAILIEDRVAVTPLAGLLRLGGTMEISGMNDDVKMHKVRKIHEAYNKYYSDTEIGPLPVENIWYGYRPCSFDGLPYIGGINSIKNITVATGHAMLGLSLGAGTGKLVSEIISGNKTSLNMVPFNPQR